MTCTIDIQANRLSVSDYGLRTIGSNHPVYYTITVDILLNKEQMIEYLQMKQPRATVVLNDVSGL